MLLDSVKEYAGSNSLNKEVTDQAEIQIKYSGYILKEKNNLKVTILQNTKIPTNFDFLSIDIDGCDSWQEVITLGNDNQSQASRISGVSPNDISVLLVYMGR